MTPHFVFPPSKELNESKCIFLEQNAITKMAIEFSIILPVHNGGSYVKSCVKSILDQTYPNFNLIILENCSSDDTLEWLQSQADPRIELNRSKELLSIEDNWARILDIKKKEFISLIGHDDVLLPNFLQTITDLIDKHPQASLYQTHFSYIDNNGGIIRPCKPMDERQLPHEFLASLLTNQLDLMGTGFVMRSKDYDAVGGIPVSYPNLLFSDLVLFQELSNLSYKATAFHNCFSFRLHQSTTSLSADIKFQKAFGQVIQYFIQMKSKSSLLLEAVERYGPAFVMFYCKALSHRMIRTRRNKEQTTTVNTFISTCITYANQLAPNQSFEPLKNISIRIGNIIDSNIFTRNLFLLFKKIYKDPIL